MSVEIGIGNRAVQHWMKFRGRRGATRCTCVTACACLLSTDQIGRNPGLQAIWEDEKQRRREKNESSQLEPPESQGEPQKGSGTSLRLGSSSPVTVHELAWLSTGSHCSSRIAVMENDKKTFLFSFPEIGKSLQPIPFLSLFIIWLPWRQAICSPLMLWSLIVGFDLCHT